MAALTMGSATVDCPVCGEPLVIKLEARKVIYSRVSPQDNSVTMTASVHVTLPDFEDPDTYPVDHVDCFTVTDEDRAQIAAFEAEQSHGR